METLRTSQLVTLWGVGDRRVRAILAELEVLGYQLEVDDYGGRRVPAVLSNAVKAAREAGQPLNSLFDDPRLRPVAYTLEADPLSVLLELSAEVALLRETFGAVWEALRCGVAGAPRLDWRALGVPDPYREL